MQVTQKKQKAAAATVMTVKLSECFCLKPVLTFNAVRSLFQEASYIF